MNGITIAEMPGVGSLEALRREWRELFAASGASPFLSWEWMASWQTWLSHGVTPLLLCARDGRELVGLLPLGVKKISAPGLPIKMRRLSFLGDGFGGADYLDMLALPERQREVATAIFDHLARQAHFDVLELDGLASDSLSLPLLKQRFSAEANFHYSLTPRFVCPQLELNGDWPFILKRSRRADNFKRRLRQLRARAGFEYRAITRPEEARAALERFIGLHEANWVDRGGSELTGHKLLRSFHREVVTSLAEAGLLRFDELWAEGACRASIYCLDDGRRYFYYNAGYDPAWRNTSPGLALLGLSIEDAIRRGVERYDFLRGTEPYKFDWATTTRETVSVLIARRGLPATLFMTRQRTRMAARAMVSALLPEQTVETVRQWRRLRKRKSGLGK